MTNENKYTGGSAGDNKEQLENFGNDNFGTVFAAATPEQQPGQLIELGKRFGYHVTLEPFNNDSKKSPPSIYQGKYAWEFIKDYEWWRLAVKKYLEDVDINEIAKTAHVTPGRVRNVISDCRKNIELLAGETVAKELLPRRRE